MPYLSLQTIAKEYNFSEEGVRQWIVKGFRVKGRPVRLAAIKVGWSWRVSPEALEAFLAACNGGKQVEDARKERADEAVRRRQNEEAKKWLRNEGIPC